MTRDEARALIQQTLVWRSDKADEIVTALKNAQTKLERGAELPWFLLTEVSSSSTVSGEERIELPSDFIREAEEHALYYYNGAASADADKWVPLLKDGMEFLRSEYPGSGAPQAYAQVGVYDRIFPTPDDAYTIKRIYFKNDAVLSTNIENNWLKYYPFLIIGEAGRMISPAFRDKDGKATFDEWASEGRIAMIVDNEARMHTSRRYVMGGRD